MRNAEGEGGGAVVHGRVIGSAFRAGDAGIVAGHVVVCGIESCRAKRVRVAVDLQGGSEGRIEMLTIRDHIVHHHVLESKEIRNLKIQRVFQGFAGRRLTAPEDAHGFLDGDGFIG